MTTPFFSPIGDAEISPVEQVADLIDEMLHCFAEWRESASDVADAYARWSSSLPIDEAQRFSAYISALDQEEAAAISYAGAVSDVESWWLRGPA